MISDVPMRKKYCFPKFVFTCFLLFASDALFAQPGGWNYSVPIDIINKTSTARTNYQELIVVNTKSLISSGKMLSSGADIRFGDLCSGNITFYSYFIHENLNTDSTKIWVKVPNLPANSTTTIFIYYGNSGASAASSFSSVFPNAKKSGGPNDSIGGINNFDWFEIESNDTFFIKKSKFTEINARVVVISGAIFGNGAGNVSTALSTDGVGSGGGKTSSNNSAGSGGAGYGTAGGDGGYDAGDIYGVGGSSYGTLSGTDIDMGSSGGSSDIVLGGAGGGGLKIKAECIYMNGTICINGTAGAGLQARNGGGGSGGGALLWGSWIYLNGNVIAKGGDGGVGTSTANDDGGGGSGGRVKVLYNQHISGTLSTTLTGGKGGPNGTAAGGGNGGTGTVFNGFKYFGFDSVVNATLDFKLSDQDKRICFGTPLIMTAKTGFTNYKFYLNNTQLYSGTNNVYTFKKIYNGDSLHVFASMGTCYSDKKSVAIDVDTVPVVDIICDTSVCSGDTLKLRAIGAKTYTWIGGPKTDSWQLLPQNTDIYTVIGKDGNGCVDTTKRTVPMYFRPSYSGPSTQTLCVGDSTTLSVTGPAFCIWENQFSGLNYKIKPVASRSVIYSVYDNPACRTTDSVQVVVNPLPNVYISGKSSVCPGQNLVLGGNGAYFYTWNTGSNYYLETFKPTKPETVWVIGKDDKGCKNIAYKNIYVDTPMTISISGDLEFCKGESTILTGSGAADYKWSTGGKTSTETLKPDQSLAVTLYTTDIKGCKDTNSVSVTVNPPPIVTFDLPNDLDTLCVGDNTRNLSGANPTGGAYSGKGVANNSITPSVAGTGKYYIKYVYTDPKGCMDSAQDIMTIVDCLDVKNISKNEVRMKIFPNPANGNSINITSAAGGFYVVNSLGQKILFFNSGGEYSLDVSSLPNGSYWILENSGRITAVGFVLSR